MVLFSCNILSFYHKYIWGSVDRNQNSAHDNHIFHISPIYEGRSSRTPETSWKKRCPSKFKFYGGWTALHYAISNGNTAVCRLLLNEKADPYIEDGANSLSALEWAWVKILGKSFPPGKTEELKSIFTDRGCLEEMGFTHLHKLVLGLEGGDLATQVAFLDPGAIDLPDFSGRTALSWAAQRGDLETVNILLNAGANPNIATPSGMAPLHYASEAINSDCIQPLLSYNANAFCVDQAFHTALHFAAKHSNDLGHITPLIEAGIDPDSRTDYDYTPLMSAIYKDYDVVAKFLLDSGAELNGKGQGGKTPIIYAVKYNAHLCLRLLLDRGADIRPEIDDGQGGPTIAHMVARFADVETVRILNQVQLPYLTLEVLSLEDYEGKVLDERVRSREELEECVGEFRELFDVFLLKITDPAELVSTNEQDQDVFEEFFDAIEA